MFEFPTTRPTRSGVVRSTTDSGALPKTVEIPTISRSGEFIRTSIAKQSSGSAFPPLHAASVSIHTRDGRSTCGPPRTSGNGRSSGSPVRQFRTGPMHVSGSRAAATSNSETPTRANALRFGSIAASDIQTSPERPTIRTRRTRRNPSGPAKEVRDDHLEGSTAVRRLHPPAHAGLVVAIGIAEPLFQVRLLARHNAVADHYCERQSEDQDPRAAYDYADAAVDEKHAEIDGIATPTVNSSRHQRTGGLGPLNGGRCAGEVANAGGKDRDTSEDHGAGDDGADPVERPDSRNRERQRQRVIQHEAEQKSGEKKERRSSDDAWSSGAVHWLPSRVHCHVRSHRCWGCEARSHPERQLGCHPKN